MRAAWQAAETAINGGSGEPKVTYKSTYYLKQELKGKPSCRLRETHPQCVEGQAVG